MQITPTGPIKSLLLQVIVALDGIYRKLMSGFFPVTVQNATLASTQSGTWTVGVNSFTATSIINTRQANTMPVDLNTANLQFDMAIAPRIVRS